MAGPTTQGPRAPRRFDEGGWGPPGWGGFGRGGPRGRGRGRARTRRRAGRGARPARRAAHARLRDHRRARRAHQRDVEAEPRLGLPHPPDAGGGGPRHRRGARTASAASPSPTTAGPRSPSRATPLRGSRSPRASTPSSVELWNAFGQMAMAVPPDLHGRHAPSSGDGRWRSSPRPARSCTASSPRTEVRGDRRSGRRSGREPQSSPMAATSSRMRWPWRSMEPR